MHKNIGFDLLRAWADKHVGLFYMEDLQDNILKDKWNIFQQQPDNAKFARLLNIRFGLNGGKSHMLKDAAVALGLPISTACEHTKVAVRRLVAIQLMFKPVRSEQVFQQLPAKNEARVAWHKLPNHSREQVQTVLLDLLDDARKRGETASRRKLHEVAAGFWSAADGLEAALRLLAVDP